MLHGAQAWIRRVLWIAAVLYVSSSTAIVTVSLVSIVSASRPRFALTRGSDVVDVQKTLSRSIISVSAQ